MQNQNCGLFLKYLIIQFFAIYRGGGTGEASEALASPEFRGFTTEKFLASWIYERGNFCASPEKSSFF